MLECEEIENPMMEVKKLIIGNTFKLPQFGKVFIKEKGDELLNYEEETQRKAATMNNNVDTKDLNDKRWESLKSQIKVILYFTKDVERE